MQRRRLIIVLNGDEYKRLERQADEEKRLVNQQAAYLLAQILSRESASADRQLVVA